MTDAEATAAIEELASTRRWKLVCQARKFTPGRYSDDVADMINEALLAGWINRSKIECMEAYVMRCVHFQVIGWFKRKREISLQDQAALSNNNAKVQAVTLGSASFARKFADNGDGRTAIKNFRESQRMEDLNSTINACADMLTPHQRRNLQDLMAREGENGGENHGGSHAVEIRDSRVRLIMRGKREKLNAKFKRAAA